MNVTLSENISYTAPGGAAVSTSVSVSQATYTSQSAGSIDVPSGTALGATFAINFGSVATPIGILAKGVNMAFGLHLNSVPTGIGVGTGGACTLLASKATDRQGLSSAYVSVVGAVSLQGQIDFIIWGD